MDPITTAQPSEDEFVAIEAATADEIASIIFFRLPIPQNTDSFFGLLTDPPGEWGLVSRGLDKVLVLRGDGEFLKKNLNLFHSFATGRLEDDPKSRDIELRVEGPDYANRVMVTISMARLHRALTTFFYGQLFPIRAKLEPVLDAEDPEVIIDWTLLNDQAIQSEADNLTLAFIAHITGNSLGADIAASEEDMTLIGFGLGEHNDGEDKEE